jgi:colanic acid biosynthesis glycosyl transferase WcaI
LVAQLARHGDVVVPMTDPPLLGANITATAREHGAEVIHWIQDIYPEILTAHLGSLIALPLWPLRRKRDAAWLAASRCVTLSADMRLHLAAHGVPPDNIAVVPNWAPQELQTSPSEMAIGARRTRWQVDDQFIIAYSGNLGRVHEFNTILAAAEQLRNRTDIVFLFIGAGARFDQLRKSVEFRRLANIRLLPSEPRENLAASLAAAHAHLVTLKPAFDGLVFPSKLAGVLAAGRPVLFVGRVDGEIARLLAANQCGLTSAPGDGKHLIQIITQWQKDPTQCLRIGQSARATYERQFTFAHALSQWEVILQQAAALP